ncbi:MAG TPA: hypothetical protein PLQ20_00610 [Candidatus Paceibacterota bacterium]|nr:hypothetical protein [Candidatus Paceibacterota bacterium]
MEANKKFTIGFGNAPFDERHNDHTIVTSLVPFVFMELFISAVTIKINELLVKNELLPYTISVSLIADINIVGKKDSRQILGRRDGARVQFHFLGSYYPTKKDEGQLERSRKFKEILPTLGGLIEEAFEETKSIPA